MNALEKLPPQGELVALPSATMDLVRDALARGASLDIIERLMTLHERYEANQARRAFDTAMADAKAEIPIINKNRHVGFEAKDKTKGSTNYDHEDLGAIVGVVGPILGKHGLSHRFRVKQSPQITVTCVIAHRDGHFEETELSAGADTSGNKNSIQAIGSTITYLQRYLLKSALGLAASKDDDGRTSEAAHSELQTISEVQLKELLDLADEIGVDKVRYCRFREIDSFADILASQFGRAKQDLEAKRKASANV